MSLPEISITVLGEDERKSTIKEFCHGKIGVIDLWHTKCQKCPAALDKLNTDAGEFDSNDVIFIACALSLGSGNKEDVADLALETWENLSHIFIEEIDKAQAKETFGYSAVPFYIIFDRNGGIIKLGDSKAVNYMEEIRSALNCTIGTAAEADAKVPADTPALATNVFTLEEDF